MNDILKESTVVEEYNFTKPDILEIENLFDDIIKNCRNKYFHTFEYRLVYDVKFTDISSTEEVSFTITHRSMEFKTEIYGFNRKKTKMLEEKVFYLIKQINWR